MEKLEELLEKGGTRKDITLLVISGIALIISIFDLIPALPFDAAWVAIILCGVPIILEAIIGLVTRFDIKADVLVSLALIASVIIHEDFAAGEIAFIMQLGALLEDLTVAKAREGIEKLVKLTPRKARVIRDGKETEVTAEEVKVGDILRVLPGETIPVDGVITEGHTSIDQQVMTGESLPVDKSEGDTVSSGCLNQFGAFTMRATHEEKDSSIQRMIRLVQSADASKAEIVGLADRWATWVVVIALSAAAITWLVTGEVIRAVTILVVFCPCALVLATPTAIMAAIGNASKHGFLVKEGDALERLSKVSKLAFDKTGTLTYGKPEVTGIECCPGYEEEKVLSLALSAELSSEHPLGKAVVSYCKQKHIEEKPFSDFSMLPGRGLTVRIDGRTITAGNRELMEENGISPASLSAKAEEYLSRGATLIYLAEESDPMAIIALSDTLRSDAKEAIRDISSTGTGTVLLTGDHEAAAGTIAAELGISEFRAECLPQDKMEYIRSTQERGLQVCMIGDGINDAPSLKAAFVGIAMGGIGSDIAVEAADIALTGDRITEIGQLLRLSRRMMTTIKLNLTFSMTLNFVAIVLAITGVLNPVAGALVHNAGSVLVIINSAFLLRWKQRKSH